MSADKYKTKFPLITEILNNYLFPRRKRNERVSTVPSECNRIRYTRKYGYFLDDLVCIDSMFVPTCRLLLCLLEKIIYITS